MDNNELYDLLVKGETSQPSFMGIIPYNDDYSYTFDNVIELLEKCGDIEIKDTHKEDDHIACSLDVCGTNSVYKFYISETTGLDFPSFNLANQVSKENIDKIKNKASYLDCFTYFNEDILGSYHRQLKVLNALAPQKGLTIDLSSFTIMSGDWLRMTAESDTPPSPTYLYTVHAIYEDTKKGREYWLHSHGLHRCGLVEFELVDITANPNEFHSVLNTFISRMIEDGLIPPEQPIMIGNQMEYVWLPWEKALNQLQKGVIFKKKFIGDITSRDDDVHSGPSGIIMAVDNKNIVNPMINAQSLVENPVFFFSDAETARMSRLASERYSHFKQIFSFHNDSDEWKFLVKLGILVDGHEVATDREHLWFAVQSLDDDNINAVLINQPYWIERMNEGDRDSHSVELLTDWIIYGPQDSYTPDSVYKFYEIKATS